MTIYQLFAGYNSPDEGLVEWPVKAYTTREEAEKALEFQNSLPEGPYDVWKSSARIKEIEVLDKFEPWITKEELEEENDGYCDYMEQQYGEDWGGDMYD